MIRTYLHAKLHNFIVTSCDVNYEGSITLPPDLMRAADIREGEQVHVWNITNGNRIITYVIEDETGHPGRIQINGAGAHLFDPGNQIIIAAFAQMTDDEFADRGGSRVLIHKSNDYPKNTKWIRSDN